MNKRFFSALSGVLMVAALTGPVAAAAQVEHDDVCCLAAEWLLGARPLAPQSSDEFCCIANEWRMPPSAPEAGVQAPLGGSCCIAAEWNAS